MRTACTTLVFCCLPCFIWHFVRVPHPLYRRPSFGGMRGFCPTWIWVQVRRCGDNLGSGILDSPLALLIWVLFHFSNDQIRHKMIILLSEDATYHTVVGWNDCKRWCGMNYHTFSAKILLVCAVPNPRCWAFFGHRFVNKLSADVLAGWFSRKLEKEMGRGETAGLGWTWPLKVDLYKSRRALFWSSLNVVSFSLSSDIRYKRLYWTVSALRPLMYSKYFMENLKNLANPWGG